MNGDDDKPDARDELYVLFTALRTHVAEVFDDFADRVIRRLETYLHEERFQRPLVARMMASAVCQTLNLAAREFPSLTEGEKPDRDTE